jgi:hypothetical protein
MYSDLMSQDGYLLVNKKLLRVFGADLALYWAVLSGIIGKVLEKKDRKPLVDEDGYFTVDRDYISLEAGLTLEQQYNCDSILVRAGVLNVGKDKNKLQPDLHKMIDIMVSDDDKYLQTLSKKAILPKGVTAKNANAAKRAEEAVVKEKTKELRTLGQKIGMYKIIDQHELAIKDGLADKLHEWVDSVYERGLFLNGAFVTSMCDSILNYTEDKKVRADLVDPAIKYGYREFQFILDVYMKSAAIKVVKSTHSQPTTTKRAELYEDSF